MTTRVHLLEFVEFRALLVVTDVPKYQDSGPVAVILLHGSAADWEILLGQFIADYGVGDNTVSNR